MRRLRIATFNLLHGTDLRDGTTPPGLLREAVAALDADVVALQEVDRLLERSGHVDQAALAAEALGARDWRFASAVTLGPPGWHDLATDRRTPGVFGPDDTADTVDRTGAYGIALLSRLPVLRWRLRSFPSAPVGLPLRVQGRPGLTHVDDHPRPVLAAVLDAPGGPVTVLGVHLSFVPGWNAAQLARITRSVDDLPGPCLLAGDLNLPGPLPRATTGWRRLARTATYPSPRPRVQFDHVLERDGCPLQVLRTDSVRMPVSDHRALILDVAL